MKIPIFPAIWSAQGREGKYYSIQWSAHSNPVLVGYSYREALQIINNPEQYNQHQEEFSSVRSKCHGKKLEDLSEEDAL